MDFHSPLAAIPTNSWPMTIWINFVNDTLAKELVALNKGCCACGESCTNLLRDRSQRGMRAPALPAGDGALGF